MELKSHKNIPLYALRGVFQYPVLYVNISNVSVKFGAALILLFPQRRCFIFLRTSKKETTTAKLC